MVVGNIDAGSSSCSRHAATLAALFTSRHITAAWIVRARIARPLTNNLTGEMTDLQQRPGVHGARRG